MTSSIYRSNWGFAIAYAHTNSHYKTTNTGNVQCGSEKYSRFTSFSNTFFMKLESLTIYAKQQNQLYLHRDFITYEI